MSKIILIISIIFLFKSGESLTAPDARELSARSKIVETTLYYVEKTIYPEIVKAAKLGKYEITLDTRQIINANGVDLTAVKSILKNDKYNLERTDNTDHMTISWDD